MGVNGSFYKKAIFYSEYLKIIKSKMAFLNKWKYNNGL